MRRRYVFDVHQQICDDSLAELLPDLEKIVLAKFDCKEILHRLKDNNEKMTTKEKVTLWQTMKVIFRLFSYKTLYTCFIHERGVRMGKVLMC